MDTARLSTQNRTRVYWVVTAIAATAFAIPGIGNLAQIDHMTEDIRALGYPSYFLLLLGSWKLLGAAAIVAPGLPRLKEWAYAGMIFDVTGAAFSRAAAGHPIHQILIPLTIAGFVAASWSLRPAGRKLVSLHHQSAHA